MVFGKRKLALILVVLALVLSGLACTLPVMTQPSAGETPIPVSTQAVGELEENVATAVATASSGQPVSVQVTEAQLTSLVALQLQSQPDQILTNPQIHLNEGQILVTGDIQQNGLTLPLEMILTVSVDSAGEIHYQVQSAKVGPFPLPQETLDQLSTQLDEIMAQQLDSVTEGMVIDNVVVGSGVMTITGHSQ